MSLLDSEAGKRRLLSIENPRDREVTMGVTNCSKSA